MKQVKFNKIYGFILMITLATASFANATNIASLKLNCKGIYKVISAEPYYIPAPDYPTRAPNVAQAGAKEQIQIIELKGKDCHKLKPFYNIDIQVGTILPFEKSTSPQTSEQAHIFAKSELNKIYSFKVNQEFNYTLSNGELPFFPFIHSESIFVLGLSGIANSEALYGTPSMKALDDNIKLKIAKEILNMKSWGKIYQNNVSLDADQWLNLLLKLEFNNSDFTLEYLNDLIKLFHNMVKETTQFYFYSAATLVTKKISLLLNVFGKTKWSSKSEILKMNPALLTEQHVQFSKVEDILKLDSTQIEEFLEYSVIQVQNLKLVPQIYEAQVLKSQYLGAAKALLASPIMSNKDYFDLSPKSKELINLNLSL